MIAEGSVQSLTRREYFVIGRNTKYHRVLSPNEEKLHLSRTPDNLG